MVAVGVHFIVAWYNAGTADAGLMYSAVLFATAPVQQKPGADRFVSSLGIEFKLPT